MERDEIIRELVTEGADDWVPLLSLIYLAKKASKSTAVDTAEIVNDIVRSLLDRGLMTIGALGADGHEPWLGDNSAVIARFISEMTEIDWKPDTVSYWLANTERGDQLTKGF